MSMPSGRCDVRGIDQSAENPKHRAAIREPFRSVAHYNRLELAPMYRTSAAAKQLLHQPAHTAAPRNGRCDSVTLEVGSKSLINLFLVHPRESCNKQVSGVSPFRKGIVL
jgi:hypothetical protein